MKHKLCNPMTISFLVLFSFVYLPGIAQETTCSQAYPLWVLNKEFEERFLQAFPGEMYGLKKGEEINWLTIRYKISSEGKPVELNFFNLSNKCNKKCVDIAESIIRQYALKAPARIDPKNYKLPDSTSKPVPESCYNLKFTYAKPPSIFGLLNDLAKYAIGK